jgi:hypothetical protein
MKKTFGCAVIFGFALAISANSAPTEKTDPLTGLPLYPATNGLGEGGGPLKLDPSAVCKSKMDADLYEVTESKVDATVAWCAAHFAGFRKAHGYGGNRSRDIFYKTDGTLVIEIVGSPGKEGENQEAHTITYSRFSPGLTEQTILGMAKAQVVCP